MLDGMGFNRLQIAHELVPQPGLCQMLARLTSPILLDPVDREGRNEAHELGWNEQLVGAIREGLKWSLCTGCIGSVDVGKYTPG